MESQTSQKSESSNSLSPTLPSPAPMETEEDFLSSPLEALAGMPLDKMTPEQRREFIITLRDCRQSYQTYKAKTEEVEREKASKPKKDSKPKLDEFKEFF